MEALGWAALLQVKFSAESQERVEDRMSGKGWGRKAEALRGKRRPYRVLTVT